MDRLSIILLDYNFLYSKLSFDISVFIKVYLFKTLFSHLSIQLTETATYCNQNNVSI